MIRPTPRCVVLWIAGLGMASLPVFVDGRLWVAWAVYVGLVLFVMGIDALQVRAVLRLDCEIEAPANIFIGHFGVLMLQVQSESMSRPIGLEYVLDVDELLHPVPPGRTVMWPGQAARLGVPLHPRRRGTARIDGVWFRGSGPLGLMLGQTSRSVGLTIPVVPNIAAVHEAALRYFEHRSFLAGVNIEAYQGDGSEFDSMREYVTGLDHRSIDWKASARHRKLVCREFQAERDQQLVFALDTGRLMGEQLVDIPKLDHAINAALLLSYFSLRNGDRVGMMAFDAAVRSYVQPRGGMTAFHQLQLASSALKYSEVETNFTLGLVTLSSLLHRRSLVIVITDFVDTIAAELMLEALNRVSRRHLVLFVTLRDPGLQAQARAQPHTTEEMARSVVSSDLLHEREVVMRRLERMGIHGIDVRPRELSSSLLNRYLDIKRRELIA